MSTISQSDKVQNLHTPVANQPGHEPAEKVRTSTSQPGSLGSAGESNRVYEEMEEVKGHEKAIGAVSEVFTALQNGQLRDIGEASFGAPPPLAKTVHGPDNRVPVTNTTAYPWRVHASLLITAADNSQWIGTGWFIGPHTLMTAGHVVFIKGSGVPGRDGWVKNISVMPGRNGASLPFGSVTSSNFRSVTGWTNSASGDENYDYGAIVTPTNLGDTVGWFGFGLYSDADIVASMGNISGYPGDKPAGTQWYDYHKIASVNSRKVYYDIDSFGGQSGSALYRDINGSPFAMGVHAYGGATTNSATRIVQDVYNNMVAWKA
jgi:V8-like Glu-specific endopeptidase